MFDVALLILWTVVFITCIVNCSIGRNPNWALVFCPTIACLCVYAERVLNGLHP